MERHMGYSSPSTFSCFCIYPYNLYLLAESKISIHNNYFFEKTMEHCIKEIFLIYVGKI